MECEGIVEKVRVHAITRIQSAQTPRGCRVSLPLLEPSGDVISVVVERGPESGVYYVTDGGRLSGLLFESSPTTPSLTDRHLVTDLAERATLQFDDDRRVYYATADSRTLGYWAFEVARTIATVASMVPRERRRRKGRRLSRYVYDQLVKELNKQGLRGLIQGPRSIKGITEVERRVDISYRARRENLEDQEDFRDVFVITADVGVADPVRSARQTILAAHDLSALDNEPTTRIVHGGLRGPDTTNGHPEQAHQARRLIESVASAPRIEEFSWDDSNRKEVFVAITRNELTAGRGIESIGLVL